MPCQISVSSVARPITSPLASVSLARSLGLSDELPPPPRQPANSNEPAARATAVASSWRCGEVERALLVRLNIMLLLDIIFMDRRQDSPWDMAFSTKPESR